MYDAQKIEKKWQSIWKDKKVFEANPIAQKPKKFITVPYPYASGTMHIGHGRSYVNGDVFARYYRAKGYNVLFPMAFHITGTPVLAISSSIERGDEEVINRITEYVRIHTEDKNLANKIVQSFVDPWNVVKYFSEKMKVDLNSIGMSLDWRREFTTGDKVYNRFIEWQYHHLNELGYIEKGEYPILYCPCDKNAVGEDDISSGDELDLNINEFVCIKFPFEDGFLVASTLRPETIYGVTNIWIKPNGKYVKASVNNENWFVSEEATFLLENQNKVVVVLKKFKGEEIVGKKAADIFRMKEIPILPGDFVDTATATGVVYSVPAHAPYDYRALLDLQKNKQVIKEFGLNEREIELIYPIAIIELKGFKDFPAKMYCEKYCVKTQLDTEGLDLATSENYKEEFYNGVLNEKCGKYEGMSVSDAALQVSLDLIEENEADRLYVPVTKNLRCKCGETVIVSILKDQWFLNFNAGDWKEKAFKCLNTMDIVPNKYRLNFENIFNWLEKRPCARKRGLGTKFPLNKEWIIESLSDSTIYMAFYTIIHKIKQYQIKPEQLTLEFFDYIYLNKGNLEEIANSINLDVEFIKELQSEFLYWYPVDHRHTAIMHISNHLSFYIFHHVAIFPENHWPRTVSLIEPLIREGQKMGKSKGNVINLADIKEKYSADLFRFFITHSADFGIKVDWRAVEIQSTRSHLTRFYSFMEKNIELSQNIEGKYQNLTQPLLKVTISKIWRIFELIEESISSFNLRRYLQVAFYDTFNLIQEAEKFSEIKEEFLIFFRIVLPHWLEVLSLTIPHICEELWSKTGFEGLISTQIWNSLDETYVLPDFEREFDYIEQVIEDIQNIRKVIKQNTIEKVYLYTAPDWKYLVQEIMITKGNNFDKVIAELRRSKKIKLDKEVVSYVKGQLRDQARKKEMLQINEEVSLSNYKSHIEKKTNSSIEINSQFDPEGRAIKSKPYKPAIYIKI